MGMMAPTYFTDSTGNYICDAGAIQEHAGEFQGVDEIAQHDFNQPVDNLDGFDSYEGELVDADGMNDSGLDEPPMEYEDMGDSFTEDAWDDWGDDDGFGDGGDFGDFGDFF